MGPLLRYGNETLSVIFGDTLYKWINNSAVYIDKCIMGPISEQYCFIGYKLVLRIWKVSLREMEGQGRTV